MVRGSESGALETRRTEVAENANQDAAAMRQVKAPAVQASGSRCMGPTASCGEGLQAGVLQEEAMNHDRKMMFLTRTQMVGGGCRGKGSSGRD